MTWVAGWNQLPLPSGGNNGGAYAVSADGSVAVGYVSAPGSPGAREACYWTSTTGPAIIGASFSEAFGVSADGSVIVGTTVTTDYRPFLWTAGGGLVSFGSIGDRVYGISADGSRIVGSTGSPEQACYWNRSYVKTNLGYLPGGNRSRVQGVSNNGTFITGHANTSTPDLRAFLWTAAGGVVNLGLPVGDPHVPTQSRGFGVSNDGTIVAGDLFLTVPITTNGAFRWTSSGMVPLPIVTGSASTATAVSGDGSTIVGYSEYPGSGNQDFAYWTSAGSTITVPVPPSFSTAGTYPTGVSADGRTTVGYTFGATVLPWVYSFGGGGGGGGGPGGGGPATLTDAELFFTPHSGFVDFSAEATRRLFVATGGTPAWVGQHGALPFGDVPPVYLTTLGPPLDFAGNNGDGGGFAPTGTVGAAGGPGCTPYYLTEAAGPAADPAWRLTVSDDGGRTWSRLVKPRSAGALGQYLSRLRWLKMGQSRERMIKLECTDPVRRNIVGVYIDAGQGMS